MRRGLLLGSVVGLLNAGLALLIGWWFTRRSGDLGWFSNTSMPRRYADYLPVSTTPAWKIVLVTLAAFLLLNAAIAAAVTTVTRRPPATP